MPSLAPETPSSPAPLSADRTLPRPFPMYEAGFYSTYETGDLNGCTCTLDQYLRLSHEWGDLYDLDNGILTIKPSDMTHQHDQRKKYLISCIEYNLRDQDILQDYRVILGAIADTTPVSTSTEARRVASARMPDVIVQPIAVEHVRGDLSPTSSNISSPYGFPAAVHAEVTGDTLSRLTDLERKPAEYANAHVEWMILIDSDDPHDGADESVRVGKLKRGVDGSVWEDGHGKAEYEFTEYRGDQFVACHPFLRDGKHTAQNLLHPTNFYEMAEAGVIEEKATSAALRVTTAAATATAAAANTRADACDASRARHKRRSRKRKEKMRANGISDSSSSSSS